MDDSNIIKERRTTCGFRIRLQSRTARQTARLCVRKGWIMGAYSTEVSGGPETGNA